MQNPRQKKQPDRHADGRACIVCRAAAATPLPPASDKTYYRCPNCAACFLDPAQRPHPEEARRHYMTHENDPADPAYRKFLSRLADPLCTHLKPNDEGLDYGSGPGPALAAMFRDAGHQMAIYDPIFAPRTDVLDRTYEFVTCTETAEHFHDPWLEFDRFDTLLRPGGWLGIMTTFLPPSDRFASWYYLKDPTHVTFYAPETFAHIASARHWSLVIPAPNIALFQKSNAPNL